uniref:BET1-like protein n=1 Tax=Myxine glutinosa TaxID=7769 RepID=UPI00358F9428
MTERGKGLGQGAVENMMEMENQRIAENLATKVSRLKELALDIDQEAENHNSYLDNMDADFSGATGLLSGSVKRFSAMARSGRDSRRLMCYLSLAIVVLFFILYFIVSRVRR